jgi:hypothetical protein
VQGLRPATGLIVQGAEARLGKVRLDHPFQGVGLHTILVSLPLF